MALGILASRSSATIRSRSSTKIEYCAKTLVRSGRTATRAIEAASKEKLFGLIPDPLKAGYEPFFRPDPRDQTHRTLVRAADEWTGGNTDVAGFLETLPPEGVAGMRAAVIRTGGVGV